TVLRRLPSRACLRGRAPVHLPVLLAGPGPAACAGAGRGRAGGPPGGDLVATGRPLQRAAGQPARRAAARGNVPGRRLSPRARRRRSGYDGTMATGKTLTHLDAAGRPAIVDVSCKSITARQALVEGP